MQALMRSRLQSNGRSLSVRLITTEPGPVRLVTSIPTAVGSAVVRNRCRRRIRAVLAERAAHDQRLADTAVLVRVKPGGSVPAFAEVSAELSRHLESLLERRETPSSSSSRESL
jgi:ribonuclease P protein component